MKISCLALLTLFTAVALPGCGHDHAQPVVPAQGTEILSDAGFDGDIEKNQAGTIIITQGSAQSVFAGVEPSTLSEFRAFLDFPLSDVPFNAVIVYAELDIVITALSCRAPVPHPDRPCLLRPARAGLR